MALPARILPRPILTVIGPVKVIHVALAIALFGDLPPDRVAPAPDHALAGAACPVVGQDGVAIVAGAARFTIASAVGAALHAVTRAICERRAGACCPRPSAHVRTTAAGDE